MTPETRHVRTERPPEAALSPPAQRHAWLRALGPAEMPGQIALPDGLYRHLRTFKHDFFAATGLYQGPSGLVVLKLGRLAGLFGLPMTWLGRWLADRESANYLAAEGLPGIPRCLGRWGPTGLVHAFVEGHPLQPREPVDDGFFPRLADILDGLHRRHLAYVDLEKRENILVDEQGRPWLIDFQISWHHPPGGIDCRPLRGPQALRRLMPDVLARLLLSRLQQADRYHLLKHRRRHRPDTLSAEEFCASYRVGPAITLHRRIARPLTWLRRRALSRLTGRARSPRQEGPRFTPPARRVGPVECRPENETHAVG